MGYPDIYTNLDWEDVPTEPLEVQKGNIKSSTEAVP